ncbi:SiaC family regulatory phosphoprotein [Methylobacterium oryzae CBMB20]
MRGESHSGGRRRVLRLPLLQALRGHLAATEASPITFDVELAYFNSSSAKALMNLFMPLEDAAARGSPR